MSKLRCKRLNSFRSPERGYSEFLPGAAQIGWSKIQVARFSFFLVHHPIIGHTCFYMSNHWNASQTHECTYCPVLSGVEGLPFSLLTCVFWTRWCPSMLAGARTCLHFRHAVRKTATITETYWTVCRKRVLFSQTFLDDIVFLGNVPRHTFVSLP